MSGATYSANYAKKVLCVYFVDRCLFVLFLLAIVLFVRLRFTDSGYPFGIFKLFLNSNGHYLHQYQQNEQSTLTSTR